MLYLKAFAVGIVTALLALVIVPVASLAMFMATLLFSGGAATGGGGVQNIYVSVGFDSSSGPFLTQVIIGFAIGFLFTLWRAMVKHQAGSTEA